MKQKNMNKLTLAFNELSSKDVNLAGGKGASLGEMTQAGIPVPPGFVVLSTTFDEFLKEAGLIQEIDAVLDKVNHKEISSIEIASENIQALIKNATIPSNFTKEIKQQFKNLNTEYVAIRSSATAEDGVENAWAGQLDSFLNTKEENLFEKIQQCWASLFTPRAIFYRFEKGLHNTKISVAVVVQKMVNSEISGIAFSVHPVTEDRNQIIIEAGFGLGESIVSGQITPDSYIVEKEPRQIININVSTQNKGLYRISTGGNEWLEIVEPKASSQVLSELEILELSDLILKIESHYGFPCDIEWAFENNKFYIVQSRPITTLTKNGSEPSIENIANKYKLDSSTWTHKGFHGVLHTFFPANQSVLSMKDFFEDSCSLVLFFVKNDYIDFYWNDNDLTRLREEFLSRLKENPNYLEQLKEQWREKADCFDTIIEKIEKTDLATLSDDALNSFYTEFCNCYINELKYFLALGDAVSMHADKYLIPEFQKILGKEFDTVFPILTSTKYKSFIDDEINDRELIKKEYKKTGYFDKKELEKHAKNYFYIQNNYAKALALTANEFQKLIEDDKEIMAEDHQPEILKKKDSYIKKYNLSLWQKKLLYVIDEFFKLQDDRKRYVLISNYYQFVFLKELSRRTNMSFDLLKYSVFPEFNLILKNKMSISSLEDRKNGCLYVGTPDGYKIYTGVEAENTLSYFYKSEENTSEIKGIVSNKGKVSGRVRIILKIHDMINMEKGDILVASMTRPEMVPVMKLASAIITDEGGITCHAAIVSRELNIPCIIGTKIATKILKDGDFVEVDANNGFVRILK
jgi:phosphoenolpyruvate synthase/pyruvate phosphate dikinase